MGLPLKIHEDISAFKLYLLDCGLLGAMSKTPPAMLLLPSNDNTGKGDFTETSFAVSWNRCVRFLYIIIVRKTASWN